MPLSPLPPETLRQTCDPQSLGFSTTVSVEALQSIPGQKRAVEALKFGAAIKHAGYNIYVAGSNGLGKRKTATSILSEQAKSEVLPHDWIYVNDFHDPQTPNPISLPIGRGIAFRNAMAKLVNILHEAIPRMFASDEYRKRRDAIENKLQLRQSDALDCLSEKAAANSISILRTQTGFTILPVKDGKPLTQLEFEKLPKKEKKSYQEKIDTFQGELGGLLKKFPRWEQEHQEKVQNLNEEFTSNVVSQFIDDINGEFSDLPKIVSHLAAVRKDLIANVIGILQLEQLNTNDDENGEVAEFSGPEGGFNRYTVNLLVSQNQSDGAPVLFEHNPTLGNLVGRIEHVSRMGTLTTNFRLIKSGALHRANGGYLILNAQKLLTHPFAWESLKRCLRSQTIDIETSAQMMDFVSTVSLDPEPIPLNIKVVLIGDYRLYNLLCQFDPEFTELFKVIADFDDQMPRNDDTQKSFAAFLTGIIRREKMKEFKNDALACVIDENVRMAGDSEKISSHVEAAANLLREADFFADAANNEQVNAGHVHKAIKAKEYRRDRIRQRLQESITRDITLIDTCGETVGQVNGLSVLQTGGFMFGQPNRITCSTRPGEGRIIDIEREVELGGPLHSKGVLILSGFLGAKFSPDNPLSLYASLVFEQSYSGVDGDSASSAELYALLSSLADLPLKQGFAVTGSVNQHGDVQAIGGVNQKIEGFFDICRDRGFTGEQGVLIPSSNVVHLMLRPDVVEVVKAGQFNIYPISHIDEGIEILSGVEAGSRQSDSKFDEQSVYRRVEDKLTSFTKARRALLKGSEQPKE